MSWYQVPGDPPSTQRIMRVVHGRYLAAYAVALAVLPGVRLWELSFHAITRGERGSRLFDTKAEARKAAEGAPSPCDVRMSAALWRMMQAVLRRASLTDSMLGNRDTAITHIWALVNEHTTNELADILDENPQFSSEDTGLLREYTVLALYEYWATQPENALSHQVRDTLTRIRLTNDMPAFKSALDPILTQRSAPTKPVYVGAPVNGFLLNLIDGSWIAINQNDWHLYAWGVVNSIIIGAPQEDKP